MTASIGKFAPCAIVLAAVAYCCWPYLEDAGPRPGTEEERKLPEIAASVLAPKIEPAPGRDPFGMTGDVDMFKVLEVKTKKDAGQPVGSGTVKMAASTGDNSRLDQSKLPASEKDPEAAQKSALVDLKVGLNSLTLNATYLNGERRTAMINNVMFTKGDLLDKANISVRSIKVAEIYPHKVLLERQGHTAELGYPDGVTKSDVAPRGPAAPAAKPATPPQPAARQAAQPGTVRPTNAPTAKSPAAMPAVMKR